MLKEMQSDVQNTENSESEGQRGRHSHRHGGCITCALAAKHKSPH